MSSTEKRFQTSGILLITGLLIELFSLFSNNPAAFVFFVAASGFFLGAGIILYLSSMVGQGEQIVMSQQGTSVDSSHASNIPNPNA